MISWVAYMTNSHSVSHQNSLAVSMRRVTDLSLADIKTRLLHQPCLFKDTLHCHGTGCSSTSPFPHGRHQIHPSCRRPGAINLPDTTIPAMGWEIRCDVTEKSDKWRKDGLMLHLWDKMRTYLFSRAFLSALRALCNARNIFGSGSDYATYKQTAKYRILIKATNQVLL